MPQTTLIQQNPSQKPTQESTCATCTKFKDYKESNGRGWCNLFDCQSRRHHNQTQDCLQQIESEQIQELLNKHKAFTKLISKRFPGVDVFKQDPEPAQSR